MNRRDRIGLTAFAALCVLVTSARADTPCDAKFTKLTNVLMKDNETGLVWRAMSNSNGAAKGTWSAASNACKGLGNGFDLPDVMQMQTLVDDKAGVLRVVLPSPAPTTGAFWTGTPSTTAGQRYIVNQNGGVGSSATTIAHQYYCVKTQ